jgi:hypothetical protein
MNNWKGMRGVSKVAASQGIRGSAGMDCAVGSAELADTKLDMSGMTVSKS